eukprot:COSAG01_NODE_6615_length_3576_cov_9.088007_3_plen_145_part_00
MARACDGFLDANYGLLPISAALGRSVTTCKAQNPPTSTPTSPPPVGPPAGPAPEPLPPPTPEPEPAPSQPCTAGAVYQARQTAMVSACCPPGAQCPPTSCDLGCKDAAIAFYRDCDAVIASQPSVEQQQLNSFRALCEAAGGVH